MTGTLRPTKARLALLQAVADGAVTQEYPLLPQAPFCEWDRGPGRSFPDRRFQRVTASVAAFHRAGWIRLGDRLGEWYKSPRRWEITPVGQAVLDAADGAS